MSPARRLILGIETSCDETAAAIVEDGTVVLSSIIASQHDLHEEYKGVVPEIASRAHAERILPVVRAALHEAGVGLDDVRAVAVGNRPGLIGSLLVGVAAAKALAWGLGVPLVGVDHVMAHLYAGLMEDAKATGETQGSKLKTQTSLFPALGLVVSGGHTALYRLESPTAAVRLGGTIDDAIGEAYDKVASLLGLPFPGGPVVDRLAQTGDSKAFEFPVSSLGRDSLDFSFSGLKTAVRYAAFGVPKRDEPGSGAMMMLPKERVADLCASFQHAAAEAVLRKVKRALEQHIDVRCLLVGGGVSANSLLRARLTELCGKRRVELRLPAMAVCLDNAAMIAGLGFAILESRDWKSDPLSLGASPASIV